MELKSLLDLEVNKVSKKIEDYSLMITAESGIGKTQLLADLYGDRALFLSFENSHKAVSGAHAVMIDSFDTLTFYSQQLEDPRVREKYDVVVIDTLSLLDYMVEKSVCDAYGKDLIGDCLGYNKAYKIVDKKFLTFLKKLQAMDYTMAYVCHPTSKKMTIKNEAGADVEIITYEPKVSDRIKMLVLPEIDIKLHAVVLPNGERVIYTKKTTMFDARSRIKNLPAILPFDAKVLRQEVEKAVITGHGSDVVDALEQKNVAKKSRTLEEVMKDISELGRVFNEKGISQKGMDIINKELGNDDKGEQRTLADVNDNMIPALETIIIKLKNSL